MDIPIVAANEMYVPQMFAIEAGVTAFPWTEKQFLESIQAHHCHVLLDGDQVAGFLVSSRVMDEVELLNIAVAPNRQRHGHGARLLCWLVEYHQPEAKNVFLEVRASNKAAIALYLAFGFQQTGVRKDYYPSAGGRENALVMNYEY